jgi:hypothetical protein
MDPNRLRSSIDLAARALQTNDPALLEQALRQSGLDEARFLRLLDAYAETGKIPDVRPIGGALSALTRGAYLGFGDEIAGGIDKLLGAPGSYGANVDLRRLAQEIYQRENPGTSAFLNLAGAAANPIGRLLPGQARGAVMEGARQGMLAGAVAGAGEADTPSLLERASQGSFGGLLGGGVGAGVGGALRAGGAALNRARSSPEDLAREQLLARLGGLEAAETQAALSEAMRRAQAAPGNAPIMPLDVLGEPGRRAARGAMAIDPKVDETIRAALLQRNQQQAGRVLGQIEQGLGVSGADTRAAAEQLSAARAAEAARAYPQLFQQYPEIDDAFVMELLRTRPSLRDAQQAAARLMAERTGRQPAPMYDEAGNLTDPPSLEQLDYIRRAVADRVQTPPSNSRSLPAAERAATIETLKSLTGRLDEVAPEYPQVRAQYAEQSDLLRAIEAGREFYRYGSADELAQVLNSLDGPQREFFRAGAAEAIRNAIRARPSGQYGGNARNTLQDIVGSPDLEDRVRVLFPDEASFRRFMRGLQVEGDMVTSSRRILGGSNTADKLTDVEQARDFSGLFADVLTDPTGGLQRAAVQNVAGRLGNALRRAGTGSRTRNAMGEILTRQGRQPTAQEIAQLMAARERALQRALIERRVLRGGTRAAGALVGPPAAQSLLDLLGG